MQTTELAEVRKEVARLNQIITLLLEQNSLLRQENSQLRTNMGKKYVGHSQEQMNIGNTEDFPSREQMHMGNTEDFTSHKQMHIGNTEDFTSHEQMHMGNTEDFISHKQIYMGNTQVQKPALQTIALSDENVARLSKQLKSEGFLHLRRKSRQRVSKLLIHFYNKGSGSYDTLQKLTGHSNGGVGKVIMSLKKRGVIHRTGFQQFILSAGTVQMMQRVFS